MKKLKERVIDIIAKENEKIDYWNRGISKIKETPMYTQEHKQELIAEKKKQIDLAKDTAVNDIIKLFDEEIESIKNENKYKDSDPEKTANILKMIDMTKDTMTEAEIKHLINIYGDNNIINRVVIGIAESKNIYVDRVNYLPDTVELESFKKQLVAAIGATGDGSIESLKLELILGSM